jgi:hypothetical protein
MRKSKYIAPNCCEKAKTTQTVRLGLYPENTDFGEWKKIKPKWYIVGDETFPGNNMHFDTKVEIDKCPFCGEILPDIEKSRKFKIAEGDEEYCDTCGERHMSCGCYPPEYRWKIKIVEERKRKFKKLIKKD